MSGDSQYYIYILTNRHKTVLYTGITNNIVRRLHEHKNKLAPGFTAKYNLHSLVYYEVTQDVSSAIRREKQIKSWRRDWKNELISESNPDWSDLSHMIMEIPDRGPE
ncbi:MAG: GIY-YIG nuclease family protein [Nitrospira sp.]|nr:GIY-YIG nuclease family protein [Nitrospira sp.]